MFGTSNEFIVETKEYSISFNPDTTQGSFGDPDGGPETALVFHDAPCAKDGHSWTGNQFFILKGDFRPEYQAELAHKYGRDKWNLKIEVYEKFKRQHGSRWSSDFKDWGKDGEARR